MAMSLLEQIKSTTEELEHAKGVARKGADPALDAAQKRLAKLNEEYNGRVYGISEEIRLRMQGQQTLLDSETP